MTLDAHEPRITAAPDGGRCVEEAHVVCHRRIGERMFRVRIECPRVASRSLAGHFAMLRITHRVDPLLGRPLAVYDTFASAEATEPSGDRGSRRFADFVYTVQGRFTTAFSTLAPGDAVAVCGPLGNGWTGLPRASHLLLVAGGIGQTSLLTLGRERAAAGDRVTFCWGASHAAAFGDVDDFRAAGLDVHLATLDGSAGLRGNVIDLLDVRFPTTVADGPTHVACCGPEGMMAAVGRWAARRGVGCHVSLEAPMACGIGICFTCVARVRDTCGGWDYQRTCIEGPIFDAASIEWE